MRSRRSAAPPTASPCTSCRRSRCRAGSRCRCRKSGCCSRASRSASASACSACSRTRASARPSISWCCGWRRRTSMPTTSTFWREAQQQPGDVLAAQLDAQPAVGRRRGRRAAQASPPSPRSGHDGASERRERSPSSAWAATWATPPRRLREAFAALDRLPDTRLLRASRLYRTPAWGVTAQPDFLNAVAMLETALAPQALLDESAADRARRRARPPAGGADAGARARSISTCCCTATRVIDVPGLHVPHPHLHERAFALVPLLEIAPDILIPGHGAAADAARGDGNRRHTSARLGRMYTATPNEKALDRAGAARGQARRAQAGDADLLRRRLRARARCQRRRPGAGRRFAGHGGAGPRQHLAGDRRRHRLPHRLRRPRTVARLADRRPAVPGRCDARARAGRVDAAAAGGRGDGQARRRRPQARRDPFPGRARDPGLRAPGPDAAIGAEAGRLQGPGARRGGGGKTARRRARGGRGGRLAAGAGMRADAAGRGDHRRSARSPPSASAPARNATARCWCCTTCWASTAAIAGPSSSRISSPKAAPSPVPWPRSPARCATAASPTPITPTPDASARVHDRNHHRARPACARASANGSARACGSASCRPWATCTPGHHSLVELAREHADRVVASVFVNPTQFGPNEDFSRYPRTPEPDAAGLAAAGCDVLWLPVGGHDVSARRRRPRCRCGCRA